MSSIYFGACFSHAVINGRASAGESFPRDTGTGYFRRRPCFFLPLASIMHVSDFDRDSARHRHSSCIKGRTDNIACQVRCCTSKHRNSLSLTRMYLPRHCHGGYVFDSAMIKIGISIMLNFRKSTLTYQFSDVHSIFSAYSKAILNILLNSKTRSFSQITDKHGTFLK